MTQQTWSIDAVPETHRGIVEGITSRRPPEEYWVCYGRPGNFVTYVRNVLLAMPLIGVGLFIVLAGLAGLAFLLSETESPVPITWLAFLGTFGTIGLATGCCFLPMYGIPTAIFFWRHRALERRPERNAVALGPDGVMTITESPFGTRVVLRPWDMIQQPQLRTFMALEHTLAFGPDLLSPGLGDNYDAPLSVVIQAIQAAQGELREGRPVNGEAIRRAVDPAVHHGKPIGEVPLQLVVSEPVPEPIGQMADRLASGEPVWGARIHRWNRTARSLLIVAVAMLLSLPLLLPVFIMMPIFLYCFLYRGEKKGWFLAFLPDGLVARDGAGTRAIPWAQLEGVSQQGAKAVVATPQGDIVFDCEPYGLKAEEFAQRCEALRRASGT